MAKLKKPRSEFSADVIKRLSLRGMSQKDLAEAIGYHYSSVRSVINGLYNNEEMTQKIADYLEIKR